ncbi:MAG: hypothetical protein ACREOB_12610 [Thermodesulfobacteriota bacterium]
MVDLPELPTLRNTLSTPKQVIDVLRVIKHNVRLGNLWPEEGLIIARSLVDEQTAQEILDMIEEGEYNDNSYGGTV